MPAPNVKYFRADFNGIFLVSNKQSISSYQFNEINWHQLNLQNVVPVDPYDSWELRTGDAWYRKTLKPYKSSFLSKQIVWQWPEIRSKKDFPWVRNILWKGPVLRDRPHMIIPLDDKHQLQDTLHEVVMKRIELVAPEADWFGGYREAKGIIWFQMHAEPLPVKKEPVVQNNTPEPQVTETDNISEPVSDNGANNIWSLNQKLSSDDGLANTQRPLQMTRGGNNRWRWFMLLWLLLCLWKFPALVIPSLLIFGGITFFRYFRKACLGLLGSLFVFGMIAWLLFIYLPTVGKDDVKLEDTNEGKVQVFPPKKTDGKDLLSEKRIHWWDFLETNYTLSYFTSSTAFFESQQTHDAMIEQTSAVNQVDLYGKIYNSMEKMDSPKLDSIIKKLKYTATKNKLNPARTTEMVCTFIQEIPYFLVHQMDCKQIVKEAGSGFIVEYHMQNKPCLPEIPAGVQSPYEFMHNLKGDCDTRSLLAFTILKKMGIPASVWISEAYGHSVLGVGLPIASGFYKEVNGVKHYAVELTAKGFRLGMISPEQQIESNWDIALYYNR